jgi:hypothetical protein
LLALREDGTLDIQSGALGSDGGALGSEHGAFVLDTG